LEKQRAQQILDILHENLLIREEDFASLIVAHESKDPFRVLVVTILSQNCTDVAALRAYSNLDQQVGVTVSKLRRASIKKLEKAIHVAGLHRGKARALKRLGQVLTDQYSGGLQKILRSPTDDARLKLQELPKVGPKTADVHLAGLR